MPEKWWALWGNHSAKWPRRQYSMQQTFQEVVGLSVLVNPEEKTEMGKPT